MASWNDGIKLLLASYCGPRVTLTCEKDSFSDFVRTQNVEKQYSLLLKSDDFFAEQAFEDAPAGSTKGTRLQHYFNNLIFSPSRQNEGFKEDLETIRPTPDELSIPITDEFIRWKWFCEGVEAVRKSVEKKGKKEYARHLEAWKGEPVPFICPFSFFKPADEDKGAKPLPLPPPGSRFERVIYFGPPGTGKTHIAKNRACGEEQPITTRDKTLLVQFHPSYTYQQFVEGMLPVTFPNGETKYQIQDGPLMIAYRRATGVALRSLASLEWRDEKSGLLSFPNGLLERYNLQPDEITVLAEGKKIEVHANRNGVFETSDSEFIKKYRGSGEKLLVTLEIKGNTWGQGNYVLIIDEVNRGNVPQIFGELLFALAEVDSEIPTTVRLQYSGLEFAWPKNLSILGTMNTADRSTGDLDQALKRRFEFVEVRPREGLLAADANSYQVSSVQNLFQLNPCDLSKKEKRSYCDFVIETYNKVAELRDQAPLVPFSQQLQILNSIIQSPDHRVFDAHSKLIGSHFFIKAAREMADTFLSHGGILGDELIKDEARQTKALAKASQKYRDVIEREIYPQLHAITSGDEDTFNSIVREWETELNKGIPLPKHSTETKKRNTGS